MWRNKRQIRYADILKLNWAKFLTPSNRRPRVPSKSPARWRDSKKAVVRFLTQDRHNKLKITVTISKRHYSQRTSSKKEVVCARPSSQPRPLATLKREVTSKDTQHPKTGVTPLSSTLGMNKMTTRHQCLYANVSKKTMKRLHRQLEGQL